MTFNPIVDVVYISTISQLDSGIKTLLYCTVICSLCYSISQLLIHPVVNINQQGELLIATEYVFIIKCLSGYHLNHQFPLHGFKSDRFTMPTLNTLHELRVHKVSALNSLHGFNRNDLGSQCIGKLKT